MTYKLNHVHVKASDPGQAADWYVKAFNFEIFRDTVRDMGDRFIQCRTADGVGVNISGARINEKLGDGDASAHWGLEHFGIEVDDMDAEIERLKALGAELLEGPIQSPNGQRVAFIKVPGDVRIELMQLPQ